MKGYVEKMEKLNPNLIRDILYWRYLRVTKIKYFRILEEKKK